MCGTALNPLFSIIVPVYNVEKYLEKCLYNIKNQTYSNIEVIIVYGESTDNSTSICKKYCDSDERFVMIKQHDKGLPNARNIAIDIAKGEYLIYVDSDDYIDTDTCARFAKIIDEFAPEMIVGEAIVEGEHEISYLLHGNLEENCIYTGKQYSVNAVSRREWYAPVWLNAYKKSFVDKNNLKFYPGIYHEDLQYQPRSLFVAQKVCYMKTPFYHYLVRAGSLSQERDHLEKERHDVLMVLNQWKERLDNMEEGELKKAFGGMLLKQFLYFCRTYKMADKRAISGINFRFVWKYSLDIKEKTKGIIFWISPTLYRRL